MKLAEGTCDNVIKISTKWDYAYDGDGVRTSTLTTPYDSSGNPLTASLTAYYFGGAYETRSNGSIFKYYREASLWDSFGGQSIVNEYKPATSTWTLSYMLTDHLGSVVAITDASGTLVSQQRYLPFGGIRTTVTTPNSPSTDFGYTGQRNLDSNIGLMDYKARFYSPVLNRFIQPDTIVPGMFNPQNLNRFSYVGNNPINFNDPSGHLACNHVNKAEGDCTNLSLEDHYGIEFTGNWTHQAKQAVFGAIHQVGKVFANEIGGDPSEAFKKVYGLNDDNSFLFEWDENCSGCRADPTGCDAGTTKGDACKPGFGYTNTENWIEFASMSEVETPLRNINNVIHELGHAFNLRLGRAPENLLEVSHTSLLVNGEGFYGAPNNRTWEASSIINGSETFADQFLGWSYGKWDENDDIGRADFMNQMNGPNGWIVQAASIP